MAGFLGSLVCILSACGPGLLPTGATDSPATPALTSFVLGQPDESTLQGVVSGFSSPMAVWSDGTRLFSSENGNNRVLIWNSVPSSSQTRPDIVLGQPTLSGTASTLQDGTISAATLTNPQGLYTHSGRLFLVDAGNHRVLIWNSIPTSTQTPADVVLGQPDMTSKTANNGGIGAGSLSTPRNVLVVGTKLVVADAGNHRVLIWNSIPATNQTAADVVLGQATMSTATSNLGGISAQSLSAPAGLTSDGTKLLVADTNNSRVLIWNTVPTTNHAAADVVIGHTLMTNGSANDGGTATSQTLNGPTGLHVASTRLYVSDTSNNRVMIWDTVPASNSAAANLVLGQSNFTSSSVNAGTGSASSQTLNSPFGVFGNGTQVWVADQGNHRILGWTTHPTTNQAAADVVLGQPSFTANRSNSGISVSAQTLYQPNSAFTDGTRFVVADRGNNRVLIWNSIPTSDQVAAQVVLGQPDMASKAINNPSLGANSMSQPVSAIICNSKLIVSEFGNNRILIWNSIPTVNQTSADVVLGQPDFTTNTNNTGGVSAQSLSASGGLLCIGEKLLVADYANNRVLIWNTIPTTNRVAADVVLGQPNMTSNTSNNGGASSQSMSGPWNLATDGTRLVISEWDNHRVLIWNAIPTASQTAADVVLGQPNMTSHTANNGGRSAATASNPAGLVIRQGKLYLADSSNHRLLIWNSIPTTNGAAADAVYGQSAASLAVVNSGGVSLSSLKSPFGLFAYGDYFYIADRSNDRIIALKSGP